MGKEIQEAQKYNPPHPLAEDRRAPSCPSIVGQVSTEHKRIFIKKNEFKPFPSFLLSFHSTKQLRGNPNIHSLEMLNPSTPFPSFLLFMACTKKKRD